MHFEILVEDQSGKKALDILMPKLVSSEHTFKVIAYKGIGKIPKGLKPSADPSKRILLDNLPRLLRGYGNSWKGFSAAVFVVCDLDAKCLKAFRAELRGVLDACNSKPETRFCIAIEEGEAWLLGDLDAIKKAYPKAKNNILNAYTNDAICGTWEQLADAVYAGGSAALTRKGFHAVGEQKSVWAQKVAPHMDVANNRSTSFNYFRDKLKQLAEPVS